MIFSLENEWEQVSSSLQDSSQNFSVKISSHIQVDISLQRRKVQLVWTIEITYFWSFHPEYVSGKNFDYIVFVHNTHP